MSGERIEGVRGWFGGSRGLFRRAQTGRARRKPPRHWLHKVEPTLWPPNTQSHINPGIFLKAAGFKGQNESVVWRSTLTSRRLPDAKLAASLLLATYLFARFIH